jgi:hypothetical protein
VNSPVVCGASSRVCIPELSLKKLTTGVIEAAEVRDRGSVRAAEREVEAVFGVACEGGAREEG